MGPVFTGELPIHFLQNAICKECGDPMDEGAAFSIEIPLLRERHFQKMRDSARSAE
jgi:hypothetical protein